MSKILLEPIHNFSEDLLLELELSQASDNITYSQDWEDFISPVQNFLPTVTTWDDI